MLADVLPYLACPHCGGSLTHGGSVVRCGAGHAFDVARQGYVSLLAGAAASSGDTAPMVAARERFLGAGHYAPIVAALAAAARAVLESGPDGCVVDLGAGTGYQLAAVLDAAPDRVGIALEVAKPALRRAARAHPRAGAVGCDTWLSLPIRDRAAAVALNVFAPRNAAQIHRILTEDGALIVVTPTATHLGELVSELDLLTVAPDKADRVTEQLVPRFRLTGQDTCAFPMALRHADAQLLVEMGPSAWHVRPDAVGERLAALPEPLTVTASVLVSVYRPNTG